MGAPKKILQKRNRNQAETIADLMADNEKLSEEVSRLTRENVRYAEFVRALHDRGDAIVFFAEWDDVIERSGAER